MAPQVYKVINTHYRGISGWKVISILLHSRSPHPGGINGDVQYDLATLVFKNREQLEDFHSRIIRIQQEIILSGETVSDTKLLFHYIKALSKNNKRKEFIAPNMTYLITFLYNNIKLNVYIGVSIYVLYRYLCMIGYPTTLTSLGHGSHKFMSFLFLQKLNINSPARY